MISVTLKSLTQWHEKMQWVFSLVLVCSLFMLCFCKKRAKVSPFEGAALGDTSRACSGKKQRIRATAHNWEPAAPARRWRDCREQQGAASEATELRKGFLGILVLLCLVEAQWDPLPLHWEAANRH